MTEGCPVTIPDREHPGERLPCPQPIPTGGLACPFHWERVPSRLRRAVEDTWATWSADGFGDPAVHDSYDAARHAALTWLQETP